MKLIFLFVIFSILSFAQVEEILEKNKNLTFQDEALTKIKTLKIKGKGSAGGVNINWLMEKIYITPDKWIQGDGEEFYWHRNGNEVFEKKNEKWEKSSGEMEDALLRLPNIFGKFYDSAKNNIKIEYVKTDSTKSTIVLKMNYHDGFESLEFFDSKTGLHLASEFDSGFGIEKQNFYRYERFEGMLIPTIIVTTFKKDVAPHIFTIENVSVNESINFTKLLNK